MSSLSKQKNVLLVEDDPYWQFIVGESIRSFAENVNIRSVRTAQQAEEILFKAETESAYDLIISDHHLENEMTGLDLWKKCQDKKTKTPFMMLSGLSNTDYLNMVSSEKNYPLFLQKDLIPERLQFIWKTEFHFYPTHQENQKLQLLAVVALVASIFLIPAVLICSYVAL